MHSRERHALVIGLLAVDMIALLWGSAMAVSLRHDVGASSGWPGISAGGLALVLFAPVITVVLMGAEGLYRPDDLFGGHREYAGVLRACTYAAFATLFVAFLSNIELSRGASILAWSFSCLLLGTGRFAFRRVVFKLRRAGRMVRRALIVGADEHAITIARQLSSPATGWQILGFLDDYQPVGAAVADGLRVLGDPSQAEQLARACGASDLILIPHAVSWEAQRDLLEMAATNDRPALRLAPGLYHLLATSTRTVDANFVPLLSLERLRITGVDAALKTAVDYGFSLAILPTLAVLLGFHWALTRLSGGGPLLARHPAFGRRSKPFDVLNLAEPSGDEPPGGFGLWAWRLRKAAASGRLSKLPNTVNVLRGRMSLIGPRALSDSAGPLDRPWYRTLLLVRPGITGPHSGNGSEWSPAEQAILDVAYVRDYSLWLDLRLLFASFVRTMRRERALPASYHQAHAQRTATADSTVR